MSVKLQCRPQNHSQAVRLPKAFHADIDEAHVRQGGQEGELRRSPGDPVTAFRLLAELPEDSVADGRDDAPPQAREAP